MRLRQMKNVQNGSASEDMTKKDKNFDWNGKCSRNLTQSIHATAIKMTDNEPSRKKTDQRIKIKYGQSIYGLWGLCSRISDATSNCHDE